MSVADISDSPVPEQLVDQLVRGYDALALEFKKARAQRRELENKLSWAKQQYLDALKRFTPQSASKDFHDFLGELDEAGACQKEGEADWLSNLGKSADDDAKMRAYHIQSADAAREKFNCRRKATESANGVRIWAGKSADHAELESDFTTSGTPGRLGCPFAGSRLTAPSSGQLRSVSTPRSSMSKVSFGRRSRKASFHDPIKAEECINLPMSPERSLAGSMPLCPIRFLDQHSPEEVARYFENHKHEIPRSHEFCVKRFQGDEEVIKKMDSKYGNLVSMVKDLGDVHKPMLPDTDDIDVEVEEDGEEEIVHTSASKVARWAEAVDPGKPTADDQTDGDHVDDADRESRFERPLKDVRVGESPSRPWGITVPAESDTAGNDRAMKSDATAAPMEPQPAAGSLPPLRCPFSGMNASQNLKAKDVPHPLPALALNASQTTSSHPALPPAASTSTAHFSQPSEEPASSAPNSAPHFIFNGPVFFGNYSMEQALAAMQHAGLKS